MQLFGLDFTADNKHVEQVVNTRPVLRDLFQHIFDQWKLITLGTRKLLVEEGELEPVDASIVLRYILKELFQNYALSTEIFKYFHDYSQVEYEQMVTKLLKFSPEVVCKFLEVAKEDTEKSLDYLDTLVETAPEGEHEGNGR